MVDTVIPKRNEDPLNLLKRCNGLYQCPFDAEGNPVGPMVGYAERDEHGRQYIGFEYYDWALLERHSAALDFVAGIVSELLRKGGISNFTGFCGAPEGGKSLATILAFIRQAQCIYPEKIVTALASKNSREVSELAFKRHEPDEGEDWVLVEDVCNNFSTIKKLSRLFEQRKARIRAIACLLNRSEDVEKQYMTESGLVIPVFSVVRRKIEQFRQDDPRVAAKVARGEVIWDPKRRWAELEAAMVAA